MSAPYFGARRCTAEILMQASRRIGAPIQRDKGIWSTMDIEDAIADVCINNPRGAVEALRVLHVVHGKGDLRKLQNGKPDGEIKALMHEAARLVTQ